MEEKGQERRGPFPESPLQPPAQSELTAIEGRCRVSGKGKAAEEQKGSSPPSQHHPDHDHSLPGPPRTSQQDSGRGGRVVGWKQRKAGPQPPRDPSSPIFLDFLRDFSDEITFANRSFDLSQTKEEMQPLLIFPKLPRVYHVERRPTHLLSSEHTSGLISNLPKDALTWMLQDHLCSPSNKEVASEREQGAGSLHAMVSDYTGIQPVSHFQVAHRIVLGKFL